MREWKKKTRHHPIQTQLYWYEMRKRATCKFCQLQPDEWWHSLGWKTHLPNSQLTSWPEQWHHIITLAPAGPAWVRRHTHLFCVRLKGGSVFPKHAPQSASNVSVLGIMQTASGCWLCLTFKLSIGDTLLWNDSKKKKKTWLSQSIVMTGTLFTSELEWKGKERQRQRNAVFNFHHLWQAFLALCCGVFCCLA